VTATDFIDITMEFETDTGILATPQYAEYTGGDLTVLCLKTGEENISENFSVSVFPNPADEKITVQFPVGFTGDHMDLLNVNSQIVKSYHISNSSPLVIDVSNFPDGLYLINMKDEKLHYPSRFLVTH